jgi:hypothetical protein
MQKHVDLLVWASGDVGKQAIAGCPDAAAAPKKNKAVQVFEAWPP